jgi:hypothetical protein
MCREDTAVTKNGRNNGNICDVGSQLLVISHLIWQPDGINISSLMLGVTCNK